MKLTPWFPPDVVPVHVGVYEVRDNGITAFACWNGVCFGYRSLSSAQLAHDSRDKPTGLPAKAQWRGLAEPPHNGVSHVTH